MPKKKKKSRKGKSSSESSESSKTSKPDATAGQGSTASSSKEKKSKKKAVKKERESLKQRLYADNAKGLYDVVSFMPLFIGTWLASGLVVEQISSFMLASSPLILGRYYQRISDREDIPFAEMFHTIMVALGVASLIGLYALTGHIYLTAFSALAAVMVVAETMIPADSVRRILLLCASVSIRCSLLGLVGVLSQIFEQQPSFEFVHGILGLTPGMVLASSLIARHSKVLLEAGWLRSQQRKNRKGEMVPRPGRLSQVFSLLLVLGPAIPVTLTPLKIFPPVFLLCCIAFHSIPKITEAFFKGSQPDSVLCIRCINVAALLAILLTIAGFLARLGF